jgi:recombinational DNA repair ATPase RecF
MSKIKTITVSNLKAISNLTASFNGCTAIITGGNNKGKSSLLKSLISRLQGNKPDAVVKKGEKEGFYEMELTTGEKFVWKFDTITKAGEKLIFISEKNIPGPVTKELNKYYFPPTFDVDEFLNATPKKQKETLQKLTGIDFTEFDKLYKDAYDQRTFANKRLAEEKAKAAYIDPKLLSEPIDTAELEKKIAGVDAHNLQFKTINDRLVEKQEKLVDNNNEIDRLMKLVEDLGEQNAVLNTEIEKGKLWVAESKNQPKTQMDIDTLKSELDSLKEQNKAIEENNKAKLQDGIIEKAIKNAEDADIAVKQLEAEKLEVIKNSTLPEGFGFSEEGITYEGFEFNKESLSSSRIYIAALKLAALGLGEVKALHFDASFLDKNSLLEIEKWAVENDLQLLIERPDFDGGEIEYQILELQN